MKSKKTCKLDIRGISKRTADINQKTSYNRIVALLTLFDTFCHYITATIYNNCPSRPSFMKCVILLQVSLSPELRPYLYGEVDL